MVPLDETNEPSAVLLVNSRLAVEEGVISESIIIELLYLACEAVHILSSRGIFAPGDGIVMGSPIGP